MVWLFMGALQFFKQARVKVPIEQVEQQIKDLQSRLKDANGNGISGINLELNEEELKQLEVAREREAKKWSVPPEGGNATRG